jgi:hypothetical protein
MQDAGNRDKAAAFSPLPASRILDPSVFHFS